ncbi:MULTISPECIES: sulfite exporter TauE/SafE family protein [unclassified Sphingomonas]|uniref:sulfite exporter TauE/SafE family protein n=1 Tax=unclassified Sphingomonas TaxID=196159 RepID=UPI000E10C3E4|nr:sulfite exporter TauE/SafE family protein [Sphingomonas sp. FARSPH]AXJ96457.1 sulfite exporter TauE/SafE family protein [Sphingomonas sp. FARSPH]
MIEYALLFAGAFVAAAISGSAGFAGALRLLPLFTHIVGVNAAVPLLTIAQLVGNLSRAAFGIRDIRWRPVLLFLSAALPAAALGAWWFAELPKALMVRGMGVAILIFVALKLRGLTFAPSPRLLIIGGAVVGLLSGLVGSAGLLGAAIFLSLNLPPVAYVASEATTAVAMHLVKWIVYDAAIDLGSGFWPSAVAMSIAMIAGTWAGKRIIERLPLAQFRMLVAGLLVVTAAQMIVTG